MQENYYIIDIHLSNAPSTLYVDLKEVFEEDDKFCEFIATDSTSTYFLCTKLNLQHVKQSLKRSKFGKNKDNHFIITDLKNCRIDFLGDHGKSSMKFIEKVNSM